MLCSSSHTSSHFLNPLDIQHTMSYLHSFVSLTPELHSSFPLLLKFCPKPIIAHLEIYTNVCKSTYTHSCTESLTLCEVIAGVVRVLQHALKQRCVCFSPVWFWLLRTHFVSVRSSCLTSDDESCLTVSHNKSRAGMSAVKLQRCFELIPIVVIVLV